MNTEAQRCVDLRGAAKCRHVRSSLVHKLSVGIRPIAELGGLEGTRGQTLRWANFTATLEALSEVYRFDQVKY